MNKITTIYLRDISPDVRKKVKVRAAELGISMKDYILGLVKADLIGDRTVKFYEQMEKEKAEGEKKVKKVRMTVPRREVKLEDAD